MEKKKVINYGIQNLTIKYLQNFGSEEADLIEDVLRDSEKCISDDFRKLYDWLLSGKIDFFYFTAGCKVVHCFTRSTRPGVLIQDTSFVYLKNGDLAPSSHKDVFSFKDIETHDNITIFYQVA